MSSHRKSFGAFGVVCIAANVIGACASDGGSTPARYVAKGWLNPTPQGEAEIIGEYADRADCEAAIDEWLQSQTVGNPVHAECLATRE